MDNNKENLHLKTIDIANIQTSSPCIPTKENTSHTQLQHSRDPLSFTNNFQDQLQSTAPLSPEIEETKKTYSVFNKRSKIYKLGYSKKTTRDRSCSQASFAILKD